MIKEKSQKQMNALRWLIKNLICCLRSRGVVHGSLIKKSMLNFMIHLIGVFQLKNGDFIKELES